MKRYELLDCNYHLHLIVMKMLIDYMNGNQRLGIIDSVHVKFVVSIFEC